MPGISIVQANYGTYGALGALDKLPVPFTSGNSLNNILLAWVTGEEGSGITGGITDSNLNQYYLLPGINLEDEFAQFYVCPSCRAGANTVTANGCEPSSYGGPNLVIVEILPPPCPIGSTGIQEFQGEYGANQVSPSLGMTTRYNRSQGEWWHTLICALFNNTNNDSDTARTWTFNPDISAIAGAMILEFPEFSGKNSGAIGFSTVAYPNDLNTPSFSYSPSTPPIDTDENLVIGVLFSTLA
jgi:hypothetical protein